MLPFAFLVLWAGLVGLITGSYLNVVIHRLPQGVSTVTPRSRCPACGAPIRALDNLPVLSWILLGARCRDCRAPISPRYPLVEAATGGIFAFAVARFGWTVDALAAAVLAALLVALAGIDFDHFLLPDRLTLPGLALGLLFQPFRAEGALAQGIQGALLGAGVLLVLSGLWRLARGVEGMGLGDVKMLAMIGAFLGVAGVVVTLVVASFAGSVAGLALIARGRGGLASKLPFGVFLALGGLVALFWGQSLAAAYLGLLG